MIRKRLRERLEEQMQYAISLGALPQADADEIRRDMPRMDILALLQLLILIAELIIKWLESRG